MAVKNKIPPKSTVKSPPPKAPTPATKPPVKQVNAPPKATPGPEVETTALAKNVANPPPVVAAPAWLQKKMAENGPRGLDKMDNADLILPRLILAQAMSPEVTNGAETGLDVEVGDIFDNLTKEVLCKAGEELEIIPIILGKSRFHLQPFDEGGGILCRSDDAMTARSNGDGVNEGGEPTKDCASCIRKEWDEEKGKPECSLFYNIIVLLPSRGLAPYVWSCKHTNVKVIKRFLSTAKQLGVDFFARKYAVASVTEKSANFTYKNFTFRSVDWVTEQEYQRAEAFFRSLEGKTWAPDTQDIEQEVAASDGVVEGAVVDSAPAAADDDVAF